MKIYHNNVIRAWLNLTSSKVYRYASPPGSDIVTVLIHINLSSTYIYMGEALGKKYMSEKRSYLNLIFREFIIISFFFITKEYINCLYINMLKVICHRKLFCALNSGQLFPCLLTKVVILLINFSSSSRIVIRNGCKG